MAGMNAITGRPLDGIGHLRQSVGVILNTPVGSRVMRREFGSRVPDLVDRPATAALLADINAEAADALGRWEPRLRLRKASARRIRNGLVEIDLAGEYLPDGRPVRLDGVALAAAAVRTAEPEAPRGRPAAIRAALSGGPGPLAARVVAGQGAASRIRASLTGGPGTLAARVVAGPGPDPSEIRATLAGGPGSLSARVVAEPEPDPSEIRAALSGGPGTLSAQVIAEEPFGEDAIPAQSGEVVRGLVTTGAEDWWHQGQGYGTSAGDFEIIPPGSLVIDSVRWRPQNAPGAFQIRTTQNTFRTWAEGDGAGKAVFVLAEGWADPVVLPLAAATSTTVKVVRLTPDAAGAALFDAVPEPDGLVNIVIADAPQGG